MYKQVQRIKERERERQTDRQTDRQIKSYVCVSFGMCLDHTNAVRTHRAIYIYIYEVLE